MSSHRLTAQDTRFVWVLGLLQLISWGTVFYGFALFMAPLEEALQLSRAESSLGFSLLLLAEGVFAYPVGRWIDRGHERWVMTLGSVWVGLSLWAHSQVQTPFQFYAVWTSLGLGMAGTLYPPAFAVLTRRFPLDFRRAIIILSLLGGLASTVFIPFIAWLLQVLSWREVMCVLAALHLCVCAPLHFYLLRNTGRRQTARRAQPVPAAATAWWVHLRHPSFWLLSIFLVMLMGVTSALPAHMVSLLRESGMSEAWAITVPASIGVLQVLGRIGLYTAEHRVDRHASNRWVTLLIPLGFLSLLVSQGHGLWGAVFVVLYGIGNGTLTIVKGTVMADYVSREHMGSLNGLIGLPMALARAGAPWLMGVLWSVEQGYTVGLWWMLALSVVGVAALWAAQRHTGSTVT